MRHSRCRPRSTCGISTGSCWPFMAHIDKSRCLIESRRHKLVIAHGKPKGAILKRIRVPLSTNILITMAAALLLGVQPGGDPGLAQAPGLSADQRLARDIFQELIEIDTTHSTGDTTRAAEAMAARLRA